jgi:CheY-like chemotaxis protein
MPSTKEERKSSFNENKGKRLLLVDDNPYNLFVLQSYLHPLKVLTGEALNGEEAVNKLLQKNKEDSSESYKLVLMDINMPVMDGIQASNIVKENIASGVIEFVPLIALSGESKTEDEKRAFCKDTGFSEFMTKPILKDEFIKLLVRYNIIF